MKRTRGELTGETLSSRPSSFDPPSRHEMYPPLALRALCNEKGKLSHACTLGCKLPGGTRTSPPLSRTTRVSLPRATIYLLSRLARSCRGDQANIELSICGSPSCHRSGTVCTSEDAADFPRRKGKQRAVDNIVKKPDWPSIECNVMQFTSSICTCYV